VLCARPQVVARLVERFLPSDAPAAEVAARPPGDLLTPARLLLLLLRADTKARHAAAAAGLVGRCLDVLEAWQAGYRQVLGTFPAGDDAAAAEQLAVPVWVEASLLLLDTCAATKPPAPAAEAAAGAAAPVADAPAAAEQPQAQPAAAAAAAAPAAGEAAVAADAAPPGAPQLPAELAGIPGLARQLAAWQPCGLLEEGAQGRAMAVGLALLSALHSHADRWDRCVLFGSRGEAWAFARLRAAMCVSRHG
jgi:hypothetical protein